MNWSDYPNFSAWEFDCKHTGENGMHPDFMERLQLLRQNYGQPMRITSGYRHPTHPIEASKSGGPGAHSTGRACDISVAGADALVLTELALWAGFTGVGWMQKGQSRFIHLDDLENSPGRPRPWCWSY